MKSILQENIAQKQSYFYTKPYKIKQKTIAVL